MRTIHINRKPFEVASSFNELQPSQVLRWVNNVLLPLRDVIELGKDGQTIIKDSRQLETINLDAFELLINNQEMCELLSIPQILREEDNSVVKFDQQPIIYSNIMFLIQEKLSLFLFQTPDCLKPYQLQYNGWEAPAEKFNNLRVEEYFFAEELYQAFLKKLDWKNLAMLATVLYRPPVKGIDSTSPDFDGDIREPFNRYTFESRTALIDMDKDQEFLACVFAWYHACRIYLESKYPLLFERRQGDKFMKLSSTEQLIEICGGAFDFDKNKTQRIHFVFADLHGKLVRAKRKP